MIQFILEIIKVFHFNKIKNDFVEIKIQSKKIRILLWKKY